MEDTILYRIDEALEGGEDDALLDGHLELIRQISMRPTLNEADVFVRSMWLSSTNYVEADGLQFSEEALHDVARLAVGQSVIVGHDKSTAPIARIYHAMVTDRPGHAEPWVRAWFYWARSSNTQNGVNIKDNIDLGVWKGVSVSFRFSPTDVIKGIVRKIRDVLEASVVFREADKGAAFAGARSDEEKGELEALRIDNEQLKSQVRDLQGRNADLQIELAAMRIDRAAKE